MSEIPDQVAFPSKDDKTKRALELITNAHPEQNRSAAIRMAVEDRAADIDPEKVLTMLTSRLDSLTDQRELLDDQIEYTKARVAELKRHL